MPFRFNQKYIYFLKSNLPENWMVLSTHETYFQKVYF